MSFSMFIAALILGAYTAICWYKEWTENKLFLVLDIIITAILMLMFSTMGTVGGIVGLGVSNVFSTIFMNKIRGV